MGSQKINGACNTATQTCCGDFCCDTVLGCEECVGGVCLNRTANTPDCQPCTRHCECQSGSCVGGTCAGPSC